ncbi:MAG TPA: tyrosine-type recombinase/integrase [Patescibacteria group bacterium]
MKTAISNFQEYLTIQRGCSLGTVQSYSRDLRMFNNYLEDKNWSNDVSQIQEQEIISFLAYLSNPDSDKKPNSVITRARKLSSIRSFFTFLRKRKYIDQNPSEDIELPSLPELEPEYLKIEEYQKLLRTIRVFASPFYRDRDLAIFSLFLATGIRVSELVGLKISDVDLKSQQIKVRRKGNKEQSLPLNDEVTNILKKYLSNRPDVESDSFFISKKKGGIQANTLHHLSKKYLKMAGIKKRRNGLHLYRHTFLSTLLANDVNPVLLQELAGHRSFETTRRYLHINNQQTQKAVAKISLLKGEI